MMKKIRSRFKIPPLAESYGRVSQWFATPLGRRLLIQERKAVAEEMRYLFGYHFMQLSAVKGANFASGSRINHCFSLAPTCDAEQNCAQVQGVVNYEEMPFDNEVMDVTILHHVLEFSKNPQQVVKEAARVTIPRGYIILVVFNPVSLAGIFQPLGALLNYSGISRRRALRAGRMRDWLEFLDCSCTTTRHVFHNLPINNANFLGSSKIFEKFRFRGKLPGGMSYIMVARKDKLGMTPLRPKWDKSRLLNAMPIPKQAMNSEAGKETHVLPFRPRTSND